MGVPSSDEDFLDMVAKSDSISSMNRIHRKTLANVFAAVPGNIEWRRIEALFKAVGCLPPPPHPGKDALRYQILAARDFLKLIGVAP